MKKLFVLAAAILMAGAASAQWNISANLGFNSESNLAKVGNTETTGLKGNSFTIGISPEYAFNSNWAAGIDFFFTTAHSENGDKAGDGINALIGIGGAEANSQLIGFKPYVRRNVLSAGNFTAGLILEGDFAFGNVTYKKANGKVANDNPVKAQQMGACLYPVVTYRFNSKWSVDMYLEFISVYYLNSNSSHVGETTGIETKKSVSEFGAGVYGIEFSNDAFGTLNRNLMTFCIKYSL